MMELVWLSACLSFVLLVDAANGRASDLTADIICSDSRDCPSDFFCRKKLNLCSSCTECRKERGNLQICQERCFPTTTMELITSSPLQPDYGHNSNWLMNVVVVVLVVTAASAVGILAWCVCQRRIRNTHLKTPTMETSHLYPSELTPSPPCAGLESMENRLLSHQSLTFGIPGGLHSNEDSLC